jgi:uncharacterized iron-regulated protein
MWILLLMMSQAACASPWQTNSIYTGTAPQEKVSLSAVASVIQPGTVVIVSELHTSQAHHEHQVQFLSALAAQGYGRISVGMEFFTKNHQSEVDQFVAGSLSESAFLKKAQWQGGDFNLYRRQVLFPRRHGGNTVALNARDELSKRIGQVGLAGLSYDEQAEIPAGFTLGNSSYYDRFVEFMGGADHMPGANLNFYFEAQSNWDETMASVAADYMRSHPKDILMIIVGDGHAQYGGGLPERLRARGVSQVVTISQVDLANETDQEQNDDMEPHQKYGPRADYIWVSRRKGAATSFLPTNVKK